MAPFEFEGDIDTLSARQLEFIGGVLQDRGIKNGKVTVEPVGQAGDNYVANVKRIIVQTSGEREPFQMVAKVAPKIAAFRDNMKSQSIFQCEYFMYNKVLKKFAELEKEANIPINERLKFAICYGALMDEPDEIILLEDLKVTNFVMLDRFISLTSDAVKLVLKSFARLHSLSYVLKKQDPEQFEYFSKDLVCMWDLMDDVNEMEMYMGKMENDIIAILDNGATKKRVKNSLSKMFPVAVKLLKYSREQNSCVIQQGDAWTNNIMFRLQDGNAVECCMIDYQISSKNSPVADLHYMIFNCTDYETRAKHYHEWIDYYHTELGNCLFNHGLNVKDIYTRDRLDADLRRNGKICFGQSVMLASMLMREHQEAATVKAAFEKENDITEMIKINLGKDSKERFNKRVDGLVKSFIELGYI